MAMALSPEQIESLKKVIGPSFTFEDLDLVLRKCFGDPRIHDIAAAKSPQNVIALACIQLVEREGLTVVFLRYLLAAPNCPAELRHGALAIFPELAQADTPLKTIVGSTAQGLETNAQQIADRIVGGAAADGVLATLIGNIGELRCYKELHEAVHQIHLNARPQVPADEDQRELQDFRRALRQYVSVMRTAKINAEDAIGDPSAGVGPARSERQWIDRLDECARQLQAAVDAKDNAAAEFALDVTGRTIDPLPDQINTRIFKIVRELPLDKLLDALRSSAGAQTAGSPLGQAIEAVGALRLAVLTRVLEHSRWQETDNGLFALDQTFKLTAKAAFQKFARQWPPTRKRLQAFVDGETDSGWARTMRDLLTEVDHAQDEIEQALGAPPAERREDVFNEEMSERYDALRQEARMRFFQVDSALKQSCIELLRIQAPLEAIKARVQP